MLISDWLTRQVLGQQMNDFTLPDVSLIGEHSDAAELGRMLQLILGCAVNCEQKQGKSPYLWQLTDLEGQRFIIPITPKTYM